VKSFSYDTAGRTTGITVSGNTTSYAYDYESRITTITYPNSSTNTFTYNGLDTRVGKVDSTGTKSFLRDGADVTDPVINDGASYTPGISERRSSTTKFYHNDRLGSTERLTNTSQTTTDTREYDAFGLLTNSSGSTPTPFGFAGGWGYQEDPDSGLKLLGHRYYDPSTGRFLTRDLVEDGRNWYSYGEASPTTKLDPEGLRVKVRRGQGWTDGQWNEIIRLIGTIEKTKRGRQLLHDHTGSVLISLGDGSTGSIRGKDNHGHGLIMIEPRDRNKLIDTTKGKIHPTLLRILAHELGHAIGNDGDDGDGNMNNVKRNENPIIVELGEPARTKYGG
jgi:RHS repeat-associated protein